MGRPVSQRPKGLTKWVSGNPDLDRLQDHLIDKLNPLLRNPTASVNFGLTTKGDLLAGTGSSATTRLAVGASGQVLGVDSSTTTGLAWQTLSIPSTPSAYDRRVGYLSAPSSGTAFNNAGMQAPTTSGGPVSYSNSYWNAFTFNTAAAGLSGPATETRVGAKPILRFVCAPNISAGTAACAILGLSEGTYGSPFTIPTTPDGVGQRVAAWCCKPSQSANWWYMTGDGANRTATDSGIAYTADEVRYFTIDWSTTGQVTFKTKAAGLITAAFSGWGAESSFVKTSNIAAASTTTLGIYSYQQNTSATAETFRWMWQMLEQNL